MVDGGLSLGGSWLGYVWLGVVRVLVVNRGLSLGGSWLLAGLRCGWLGRRFLGVIGVHVLSHRGAGRLGLGLLGVHGLRGGGNLDLLGWRRRLHAGGQVHPGLGGLPSWAVDLPTVSVRQGLLRLLVQLVGGPTSGSQRRLRCSFRSVWGRVGFAIASSSVGDSICFITL